MALAVRSAVVNGMEIESLYVRYFSIQAPFRSKSYQRTDIKRRSHSLLTQLIKQLMADPQLLLIENPSKPMLIYAYVEDKNERSHHLVSQMELKRARTLKTLAFSRFFPKRKLHVAILDAEKIKLFEPVWQAYYAHYTLVPAFNDESGPYFAWETDGEIALGAHVSKNAWVIHEIPGIKGWLIQHILPRIPVLRRIFQKGRMDFIALESLYLHPSHYHKFPDFAETLCAHYGVTKAFIWADAGSALAGQIKSAGQSGWLGRLAGNSPSGVMIRTYGTADSQWEYLLQHPCYISASDIT